MIYSAFTFKINMAAAAVYDNGHVDKTLNNFTMYDNMSYHYMDYPNGSDYYSLHAEAEIIFHKYMYKTTVPILFGLIIVVGLVGNCMVVGVIISKRKMRTTVNLLLLNLALSDLTFLIVCVPFVTYHYAADNWNMGDIICKLSQFLLYVTVYVTVYTLILIAAVRFFTIVYPTASMRIRTKRNICVSIGAIWAIMLIANVPILLIYRVKKITYTTQFGESVYRYCGMEDKETGQLLFLTFFILTYVLPLSIITTFYFLIMKFLHKSNRNNSLRVSSRSHGSRGERTSHATRILMNVCLVFGLSWLPLHAHLLVVYFGKQPDHRIYEVYRVLCHVMAYANSSMNPIVYNYVSKDFRKSFKELFSPYACCCYLKKGRCDHAYDLQSRQSVRHTSMVKDGGSFI